MSSYNTTAKACRSGQRYYGTGQMQKLDSWYRPLGNVDLPYRARQAYMLRLDLQTPSLPAEYTDYGPIVTKLCASAGVVRGTVFVTVDEKIVPAGQSQRRPGPHVDGCFSAGAWQHPPTWNHYCNHLPVPRMPVIVAASVAGCVAWSGKFEAEPRNNGDLSHFAAALGQGTLLDAGQAYLLSPDCVHESLTFTRETRRSFLRVALPVGSV